MEEPSIRESSDNESLSPYQGHFYSPSWYKIFDKSVLLSSEKLAFISNTRSYQIFATAYHILGSKFGAQNYFKQIVVLFFFIRMFRSFSYQSLRTCFIVLEYLWRSPMFQVKYSMRYRSLTPTSMSFVWKLTRFLSKPGPNMLKVQHSSNATSRTFHQISSMVFPFRYLSRMMNSWKNKNVWKCKLRRLLILRIVVPGMFGGSLSRKIRLPNSLC